MAETATADGREDMSSDLHGSDTYESPEANQLAVAEPSRCPPRFQRHGGFPRRPGVQHPRGLPRPWLFQRDRSSMMPPTAPILATLLYHLASRAERQTLLAEV